MKKLLAVLLMLAMVLSLVACKGKNPEQEKDTEKEDVTTSTTEKETEPEDEEDDTEGNNEKELYPTDLWAAFEALVAEYDGFEICYSLTHDRMAYAGGKDDTYWLLLIDEEGTEYLHMAVGSGNDFTDYYFVTSDGKTIMKEHDNDTMTLLTEDYVYNGLLVIDENPCVPADVEDAGVECHRYEYNFGEYAYDVAKEYGVVTRYSNINDEDAGRELVYIRTGSDVEKMEKPEAGLADGDYDDPDYWQEIWGFNYCPFYVTGGPKEYPTFYFRGGGSFAQWLNTEMNTEGWYFYNGCIITKDGKYAVQPEYDDTFSSCCVYEMTPYDGPTLSAEEQAEIKKGVVYALHSWTPLQFASWYGIALEGEEYPSDEIEYSLTDLRTDFCDQEWINVYKADRLYPEEEEEILIDHAKVYVFPHKDIKEYKGGVLTEEDIDSAMASCDYMLREDPESDGYTDPIFHFFIPNELDGEEYYGDIDLIFTYDNVIAYYVVVTSHEAGWTP